MLRELPADVQAGLEIVMGDLRDPEAVRGAVRDVSAVFHLGALIALPYSYRTPREVFDTNVMGTFNVMAAARDLGTPRVVHTSTSEVYGTARFVPITEAPRCNARALQRQQDARQVAESFYTTSSCRW
jgi:nucleoside-diphosphate-sugar epimerase